MNDSSLSDDGLPSSAVGSPLLDNGLVEEYSTTSVESAKSSLLSLLITSSVAESYLVDERLTGLFLSLLSKVVNKIDFLFWLRNPKQVPMIRYVVKVSPIVCPAD